jgi:hypothetical protein
MDWIGYVAGGVIAVLLITVVVLLVAGWIAESLLGKPESWLEYGLDDDDM